MASLGNIPEVKELYLGGIVTSNDINKFPFTGTIHSIRVYPESLNDAQVSLLDYNNIQTSINEEKTNQTFMIIDRKIILDNYESASLYTISGQKLQTFEVSQAGIYILKIQEKTYKIVIQ